MDILAICGSLREGSLNRALLDAVESLPMPEVRVRHFSLDAIPLFNPDLVGVNKPPSVSAFRSAITAADALLIATPEYNRGIPGVLKNAIDWASRPPFFSPLRGKRIAVIGASTGRGGTAWAQAELRRVLEATGARVLAEPLLMLDRAHKKISDGRLVDAEAMSTLSQIVRLLGQSAGWSHSCGASEESVNGGSSRNTA